MLHKPRSIAIVGAILMVTQFYSGLQSATVREMDRDAQAYFDKRDYNQAIGLWLSCLDMEPDNEKIQQKIEMVYEIKQRKDISYQKARLSYRVARKKLKSDQDPELELGITMGKSAIKDYITAYKLDPNDNEMKDALSDMKNLDNEIRAAEERLRLSRAMREKIEQLKTNARTEMAAEYPDYEKARKLWKEVLRYVPQDSEALEGKRKCDFAIENRIKFEKIRYYMARGIEKFDKKDYMGARPEFEEVLKVDPKHREAKDYLEKITEIIDEKMMYAQRQKQAEDSYQSGINNIKNNRFDEAQQDLETALALIKDYKDARERLKDLDRLRKEYKKREQALRLQRINQKFQEGIMAYTQGKYKEAIDAFVATLAMDNRNTQAREYLRRARDAQRINEEETVDENSPYYDVVNSLIVAGRSLYDKGQYAESRKKWDSILNLFPKNKIAREYIIKCDLMINPDNKDNVVATRIMEGRGYMDKKDFRNALRIFNIIKSIDRNYPGLDNLIAQANAGMKDAAAGGDLTPADRAELNRRYDIGMNLYQMGGKDNIEKALAQFRWVVQKDPTNVKAVVTVNKIESQLRIGGAEVDRGQMLTAKQRELVNKYYYNGINYYSNNNFQRAIEEWRKVLAIDPGNVKARNNIRKVLAFMER
ncbi:MAG TPA: tetratricopeptide repeat protein [Spirochaetota bacterium]|nr:tetratricopeptide repeat protein [Spirochaetota bacterium]HPV43603.1 tetratricopeptide repeat protein [Spirochaetota bacterium]